MGPRVADVVAPSPAGQGAARRDAWWVVGLALVAGALVLVATRHGAGVSPDSVSYLAAARSVAAGRGFLDIGGMPLAYWPPGYPALLGGFETIGVDGAAAARGVNTVLAGIVVALTWVLLRRHVVDRGLVLLGAAVVAVAPALLRTADMVWSEPLFTALVLATVLALERACARDRLVDLTIAGLLVSAAVLVRYLGFALVVAGLVAVLVACRGIDRRRRAGRAAWFAGWALLGPALWAVRNLARSLPPLGDRPPNDAGFWEGAADSVRAIGRLAVPASVAPSVATVVGAAVAALVVGALVAALRTPGWRPLLPVLLVILALLALGLVGRSTAGSDVNARIFAPVLPLLVVVGVRLVEVLCSATDARARRAGAVLVGVGVVALLGFAAWSVALALDHGRHGRQYANPRWERSAVVRAVAHLPTRAAVVSNDPQAVAHVTERDVDGFDPATDADANPRDQRTRAQLARDACTRDVYLAWFGDGAPELGSARNLPDGTLVRVDCERGS